MDAPTAADIRGWTQLAALKTADDTLATRLVALAVSMFRRLTGVSDLTTVADSDVPMVQAAIQGLAELLTFQQSPEYLDTLSDWDLITSFNAGPYSETHRSPEEARKARLIVAWPWLSELLWSLLTPDKYDYWISFFGTDHPPAFAVQEVDWSAGQDLLGGSYRGDDPYLWGA